MAALLAVSISLATLASQAAPTTTLPPPGDGLGLAPSPTVAAPPRGGFLAPSTPTLPGGSSPDRPLYYAGVAAALLAALQAAAVKRREEIDAVGPVPPESIVLFVAGFDQEPDEPFAHLVSWLGLQADQIRYFDYRTVEPVDDHAAATRRADNDELVDGLHAYLAGLASGTDRPIFLVGFSKGSAGIARLLRRWDLHPQDRIASVTGAALLDPPISGGMAGALQSVGSVLSAIPNDGGYTPTHCRLFGHLACHDTRVDLGKGSGVEVVVFRHPEAGIANFTDHPEGLRIHELADPVGAGLSPVERITTAHNAALSSSAVAACIAHEIRKAGSCVWDEH